MTSTTGSHNLSGAVIEPRALNELLPDWSPADSMPLLTPKYSLPFPHPPQMSNKENYIGSLAQFMSWLDTIADENNDLMLLYQDKHAAKAKQECARRLRDALPKLKTMKLPIERPWAFAVRHHPPQ
ncbi:hypothetical protein FRC02_011865 [Tulasnella sp. 418]|nr:hypothetical protein FRC02_011865 [Tulasnella sp. 418]